MKKTSLFYGAFSILIVATNVFGYGTPTHTAMTAVAVSKSTFGTDPLGSTLARNLGLHTMTILPGDSDAPFRYRGSDRYIALDASTWWMEANFVFKQNH